METASIRQKLFEYIRTADDKKVMAIYDIIENNLHVEDFEWWNDKQFIEQLDRISADLKSGKDKGYSWDSVKDELLR